MEDLDQSSAVSTKPHSWSDPFTPREGRALVWHNVNMILKGVGDQPDRRILDNVWGEVPPKQTVAILGPSGAGKTSLLNILAGRASTHGRIQVTSDVRLNNYAVDPTDMHIRHSIAFVAQEDSLQVTATPYEAIYFSAKLRLPRSTTKDELEGLTRRMLEELGLTNCSDTIVGSELVKGISGGERKRTSVGVELVTRPAVLFLDEPTSGLDSFSAVQLCHVLKKVAAAGASVLLTIHQPASEIFNSFDGVILMNLGRVMYQGSVVNVPAFFGQCGFPNPVNHNPADWIIHVAQSTSIDELQTAGFFPVDDRKLGPSMEPDERFRSLGLVAPPRSTDKPPGIGAQTQLLICRELINLKRNAPVIRARLGLALFMGLLGGVIFLNVGEEARDDFLKVQSQFGAMVMVLIMSMVSTAMPTLVAFPQERPVFLREYSTNHYSVVSYFMSRLAIETLITAVQIFVLCVLTYYLIGMQGGFGIFYTAVFALAMSGTALGVSVGCSTVDPKMAIEFLPVMIVPQILFAGIFVQIDLIPEFLRWLRYLFALTYALRILVVNEFEDCVLDEALLSDQPNYCGLVLENTDSDPDETWWNWLVLVSLFVFFRVLAMRILQVKANRYY